MAGNRVDALVIFGATGDLAKLETFPALDAVLGDAVPVHPYARGSWGPKEADRLLPDRDTWHDPAG